MSRSIKSIQVQVGASSKEAIDLSGSGMVFVSKTVYGASLVSANGWGKVMGYSDQACEHKVAHQLIRGQHAVYGDIARAKLIKSPFKKGATIQLVFAIVTEKTGTWENKNGEEKPSYDSVLRIVDFKVLEAGVGETQIFKPWSGEKKATTESSGTKQDAKAGVCVEAQIEDDG